MKNKGFTLIEMLVTLSIFSVVVLLTLNTFLSSFVSQKKLIEMQSVQREGSYLMETLSREIRMATEMTNYENNDSSIRFKNHSGEDVIYCRADEDASCSDTDDGDYFAYGPDVDNMEIMNSSDIVIDNLRFYVPSLISSTNQPIVIVAMTISSAKDPSVSMTIQTSVSTRIYN
ncbi:MAG: type II secretion system protein [Candidatus Pacebacteria bacterium]|nr:type II secretion system protein [Candidatus Paceibacterota bacterium]